MYIKLDEELYEKIKKITMTDYDAEGNFIPTESIDPMLNDLLYEIDRLEEKYKDFEEEVEENYKPISYAEQIGYNENDFY